MFSKRDKRGLTRYAMGKDLVGEIDRENGIVYGVSVITIGEAKGHQEYVDETTIEQVLAAGVAAEPAGIKSRFDHPNACSRSIGTYTGRFHSFRRDGEKVRADLHLADVAAKAPDGDLRTYIMDLAEEDSDAFATSIVFRPDKPEIFEPGPEDDVAEDDPVRFTHVRLAALHACDVVDSGAANDGLFGRPDYMAEQAERWARDNPGIIGRILKGYSDHKQKQEAKEMAEKTHEETKKALDELTTQFSETKTALEAAKTEIKELKAGNETAVADARKEARAEAFASLKARLEKYGDHDFVIETIELSDDEVKDQYIERVQSGKLKVGDQGETTVDFSESGDGDKATFEDKVQEKVEAGEARGKAIQLCAREFPELHQASITKANKNR